MPERRTLMKELSIVIPCYNEAGNIPLIIDKLEQVLKNEDPKNIEIILVNNGSTDNTKQILDEELKKTSINSFKVVDVMPNQGYGYGILAGLEDASGKLLAWTHADMQTDPYDVIKAYKLYMEQNKESLFVKGKRKNRKLLEAFFTWGMQIVSFFVLKTYLDDINAQPKLFSRLFYENNIKGQAPNDFSLDLYTLYQAKRNDYQILTMPVYFNKRIHGEAKGGGSWKTKIKLIKRTFAYIFELVPKPK